MTIYVIITTCLLDQDFEQRKNQYIRGINSVVSRCSNDPDIKCVIVENNGKRLTFLDDFGIPVLYTENNKIDTPNKGMKEIKDVFDCIQHFNISDTDFIIKMTGRYYLDSDCPFFDAVEQKCFDCIIRYNWYLQPPSLTKMEDCVTGLIGMTCKYVKTVKIPDSNTEAVEWNWARASLPIQDTKILMKLGIHIAPASNSYFFII